MKRILFFKGLMGKNRSGPIILVCVFIASLSLSACVSSTKQSASDDADRAGQLSATDESISGKTDDIEEIECRRQKATGSLFTRKVCLTKAQWAAVDQKNKKEVDNFDRDVKDGRHEADIKMDETSLRTPR